MISGLRWKLTIWFLLLVAAVYVADSAFAYWFTDQGLTMAVQDDLAEIGQDLQPDLSYHLGRPSLSHWGELYSRQPYRGIGVQVFAADGQLLEQYGPHCGEKLNNGRLGGASPSCTAVYSHFVKLPHGGFLQVQKSAFQHDQALWRFFLSKIERSLVFAIFVAICGWYYSGKVLEPVVRSLKILRTFIDDAGHELKTPITIIENSIETIESHLLELNLPTGILGKIERASERLSGLATNMILLARMEQPALQLTISQVTLGELFIHTQFELADMAAAKNISLHFEIPNQLSFEGDKESITILLSNLVRNALQYTPNGGTVTVSGGHADDNHIFLAVADNGIGIPPESVALIFDRFYRVDKSRSTDAGGSGLGLAIVKATVDSHGGSIKVESEPGRGSKFTVLLPTVSHSKARFWRAAAST